MTLNFPFTGIKYENVFSRSKFHPKTGLIPYIELNGEQFSDSNLIIEMLQKKFEVEMDTELSAEEEAMTRAATGMVESFTAQTGFYYRYGLHMEVGDKYRQGLVPIPSSLIPTLGSSNQAPKTQIVQKGLELTLNFLAQMTKFVQ